VETIESENYTVFNEIDLKDKLEKLWPFTFVRAVRWHESSLNLKLKSEIYRAIDGGMCNSLHCTALQRTTPHCTALQHTATPGNTMHLTTHCNSLQRTAERCNALQHTVTH